MALNRNRGKHNLNYDEGFEHENENYNRYKETIKFVLGADQLEQTTRGLMDLATGIDAVAQIQGNIYGISLRVRENDYNSFTLNRNVNDVNSEVNKWTKRRSNKIKPAYHIQIAKRPNNKIRVIRINIDAFGTWLRIQIKNNMLENYYNENLLAYEFNLNDTKQVEGVYSEIYNDV